MEICWDDMDCVHTVGWIWREGGADGFVSNRINDICLCSDCVVKRAPWHEEKRNVCFLA